MLDGFGDDAQAPIIIIRHYFNAERRDMTVAMGKLEQLTYKMEETLVV